VNGVTERRQQPPGYLENLRDTGGARGFPSKSAPMAVPRAARGFHERGSPSVSAGRTSARRSRTEDRSGVSFGRATMSNHSVDLQNCHDTAETAALLAVLLKPDFAMVGEVHDGRRWCSPPSSCLSADVIVSDVSMPGSTGSPQPRRSSRGALRTDRVRDRSLRSVADGAWLSRPVRWDTCGRRRRASS
jgi:hypothetical protein